MAKATHASGPTFTEHELSDPETPIIFNRPQLGLIDQPGMEDEEEIQSPPQEVGMGSYPSSQNAQRSNESNTPSDLNPAPTMESHSKPTPTGVADSTADSTGGSGRTVPRKRSTSAGSKVDNPRAARVRSTEDEFDEFE
jgi:hypothetical protein